MQKLLMMLGKAAELSGKAAEAAARVAFLVLQVAHGDPRWFFLSGLPLY